MRHVVTPILASTLLALALTGAGNAQTTRATAAPAARASAATPEPLPAPLAAVGLRDVITRQEVTKKGHQERHFHGQLPAGGWLRAKTRDGRLAEVKASGAALPPTLGQALLPTAVQQAAELREFDRIDEISLKPQGEIKLEGVNRQGTRIKMEFWPSGRLKKAERDWLRRSGSAEQPARERLASLGYRQIGFIKAGDKHVDALAVSPHGDWVEVRLNKAGEVDRERLWGP